MNIGILGCGKIASTIAKTLVQMQKEDIFLLACGSRSLTKAQEFASQFSIKKAYGSYLEMLKDPEIDLVYVATPHSEHYQNVMLCLENNKHVICEKALTTDARRARKMFDYAQEKNLLLTEAIWTRYMPSRKRIMALLEQGIIGKPLEVRAELSYPISTKKRLVDPSLAGGSLLDIGIYPLNFLCMFFSTEYSSLKASCTYTAKHLDKSDTYEIEYPNSLKAKMTSSMVRISANKGIIIGDKGKMVIKNINNPEKITVYSSTGKKALSETVKEDYSGYEYEFRECYQALKNQQIHCPSMPKEESIRMMEIMDEIRRQLGVVYPFDTEVIS
ncbi:MAG: Gfo/Idh/MocA family oxidoreductase [Bacilli bacterium]